jgi:phosphatidylglycerol:prolipoprotein diacylglycerol transferase
MNLVINWNVRPEIFDNLKTPNLYGLLFVSGLIIGYFVTKRMFKKENISEDILDKLVMYVVLATIIGARLGHVLFYGTYFDFIDQNGIFHEGYFSHPLSIFKVWEGGLASHGGVIALLISLWIFSKRVSKKPYLWILDRIVAPSAIAATFIRLGNLVNSEIVGDPTNVPWAFSFPNYYDELTGIYDATPRHPAQLYEAICYVIIFLILMFMYWKKEAWRRPGLLFGTFFILLFTARFFVEFIKLGQTERDDHFFINTGQMLSIPFVIVGIVFLVRAMNKERLED